MSELLTAALDSNDGEPDSSKLPEDLQNDLFIAKFDHWAYEDEVRRFVDLPEANFDEAKKIYFWPFDDAMRLRDVIVGP